MSTHEPSALSRALSTSVTDLVRGRVVPRQSPEQIIREADLPQSLGDAIHAVVRRSRLWRREKADVASELASHFRDGLDAGRSPDQLLADFGSTRTAARLIRRAKLRGRAPIWRLRAALLAAMGWMLLAFLGVYVFLFVRYLLVRPSVTRNYLAEINVPILGVPEGDRAWPLYRRAYLELTPFSPAASASFELPAPGEPPTRLIDALGAWDLTPELLGQAREYLSLNAGAIRTIRLAAARPALGSPVTDAWDMELVRHEMRLGLRPETSTANYNTTPSPNPWLVEIVSPELSNLRLLSKVLATDTRIAALDGGDQRATDNLVAMFNMGDHLRGRPWLINDLVAMAIQALALDTTCHLITDHPGLLSDQSLTRLAHAAGAIGARGPIVRFGGERLMFDDTLQRLYSDNGAGNGVLTRHGIALMEHFTDNLGYASPLAIGDTTFDLTLGPIQTAVVADRASTRALYNRYIDQVERRRDTPIWDRLGDRSLDVEIERAYSDPLVRARQPIAMLMIPALEASVHSAERHLLRRDTTLILIALELHRRRAGDYPGSLALISPTLLPITPIDRLNALPLLYTLQGGTPVVYSRGADGDDDHARPVDHTHPYFVTRGQNPSFSRENHINATLQERGQEPQWDGDWILWPPPGSARE